MRRPVGSLTLLVVVLIAVLPPVSAAAQELGIKGGWVLADPSRDSSGPETSVPGILDGRSGFSVGGFAVLPVTPLLSFQPEVLFTRRQLVLRPDPDFPTLAIGGLTTFAPIDTEFRADYLEIPALLRITTDVEGVGAHAVVGPSMAFNLGASARSLVFDPGVDTDVSRGVRDLDLGVVLGGGLTLGSRLVVEGRYHHGLVNVLKDDPAARPANLPDMRWRSFGVTVGMIF